MTTTLSAKNLNILDLKRQFGLQFTDADEFFQEWQTDLPELTAAECQLLDEVRAEYQHLAEYQLLEPVIKLVVVSPLLRLAGFYKPPFYLTAEQEVKLEVQEQDTKIVGKFDLLIFTPDFWIMVVETKQVRYSVYEGIPQALTYMLGQPQAQRPALGLVTNGSEFIFLKLVKQPTPTYGTSNLYSLLNKTGLHEVLRILKRIAHLAKTEASTSITM